MDQAPRGPQARVNRPKAILRMEQRNVNVLIVGLAPIAALPLHAADRYVRLGASGNGGGSDWTNAYAWLPSTLVRDDPYWVADGSYPGYNLDDPASGSLAITIRKGTIAAHGTT